MDAPGELDVYECVELYLGAWHGHHPLFVFCGHGENVETVEIIERHALTLC